MISWKEECDMKIWDSWEFNDDIRYISKQTFIDEKEVVRDLVDEIHLSDKQLGIIQQKAESYAKAIRESKDYGVENFIHKYSLTSEEGVAVMCLAEALLRIPDNNTANELIEDKLQNKNWKQYLGESDTLFVNAASWGLFLTGKVIDLSLSNFSLTKLIGKLGEPLLLLAIKKAIHIISSEFIMGQNITKSKKNAIAFENKGYRVSYECIERW